MNSEFSEWWRGLDADEKRAAASVLGATLGHLNNIACGLRPLAADIGIGVESITKGRLPVEVVCPGHRWHRVRDPSWPHPKGKPYLDVLPAEAA